MQYNLNILRNSNPLDSRSTAIKILDVFDNHIIGQPISLIYKEENSEKIGEVFAIGIKNSKDVPTSEAKSGPDFYKIIGDASNSETLYEIDDLGNFIDTKESIKHVQMNQDQFDGWIGRAKFNICLVEGSIVSRADGSTGEVHGGRIYFKNNIYGTTWIEDLWIKDEFEIDGVKYHGNIKDIIKIINNENGIKWKSI